MTCREETHGFLPIMGARVYVTGTRHHGFRGEVVAHEGRALMVRLDEFDEPVRLYNHNVMHEVDLLHA